MTTDQMVRIALEPDEWRQARAAAALEGVPIREWLAALVRAALNASRKETK